MPRRDVRSWILEQIATQKSPDVAARAAQHFSITRQAVAKHIRVLIQGKVIKAVGRTKARHYRLVPDKELKQVYKIGSDLEEDVIWTRDVRPLMVGVPHNILEVCEYAFTEILNNAKDHSESLDVLVAIEVGSRSIAMAISDHGIGIFRKIKEGRGLEDDRHATLELTKGKITTDPEHHTGEGIFFASRMMDGFAILSGTLSLVHNRSQDDWLFEDKTSSKPGTFVGMTIDPRSSLTMKEVFDQYATDQDDYAFQRTHVVVALADSEGGSLISRSQAKRVMARLDRFREVVLDFRRVKTIGPAFADEIFRVWQRAHLHVRVMPTEMSPEVEKMVRRALAARETDRVGSQPSD
jgi:anti-sigma regulatory factor (Ser/Thr protein kinase)